MTDLMKPALFLQLFKYCHIIPGISMYINWSFNKNEFNKEDTFFYIPLKTVLKVDFYQNFYRF